MCKKFESGEYFVISECNCKYWDSEFKLNFVTDENEIRRLDEILPGGRYCFIDLMQFERFIEHLKNCLSKEYMDLCCLYFPDDDLSIKNRNIYNLYEEEPDCIEPGDYFTLGYIMSDKKVFVGQSYNTSVGEVFILLLERRDKCDYALLAYKFNAPPAYSAVDDFTVREIEIINNTNQEFLNQHDIPSSLTIDGNKLNFEQTNFLYFDNGGYRHADADALYEYLIKMNALPETLVNNQVVFCLSKIEYNKSDILNFKKLILHFNSKFKNYFIQQPFIVSTDDSVQTLAIHVLNNEVNVYIDKLCVFDFPEGGIEMLRRSRNQNYSEDLKFIALAYEISDKGVSPMFYKKDELDNSPQSNSYRFGFGIFGGGETLGAHGLPIHYAFVDVVEGQFEGEIEMELFCVEVEDNGLGDVEIING